MATTNTINITSQYPNTSTTAIANLTDTSTISHSNRSNITVDYITKDVSENTETHEVTGSGVFDKLMSTMTIHLNAQFNANRIRQEDYANAYTTLYKEMMDAALKIYELTNTYDLTSAEIAKKEAEVKTAEAQTIMYLAEAENFNKQAEAYRDKVRVELMKYCNDTWSTAFAVASENPDIKIVPASAKQNTLDTMLANIRNTLGI